MQSMAHMAQGLLNIAQAVAILAEHVDDADAKKRIMELAEAAASCARTAAYQSQGEAQSFLGVGPALR